jgi:uncharacterized BrkB/YihY/UPF0761 family membrane protein
MLESIFFGDYWFLGMVLFIILGLVVVKLWKFAGALIIPCIAYLEVQYYELAQTDQNFVWAMFIMIIYAIMIALYSFLGKD